MTENNTIERKFTSLIAEGHMECSGREVRCEIYFDDRSSMPVPLDVYRDIEKFGIGTPVEVTLKIGEPEQWRSLTESINAGQPIDYEKLAGRTIRMVNNDGREISGYNLEINPFRPDELKLPSGWVIEQGIDANKANCELEESWCGQYGWKLYVKGELPLRKRTAEELPLGMCFLGRWDAMETDTEPERFILVEEHGTKKVCSPDASYGRLKPDRVEVIEEYGIGTFKKESE